jgi:hypothetical protein
MTAEPKKRTEQHLIDADGQRLLRERLPKRWVLRDYPPELWTHGANSRELLANAKALVNLESSVSKQKTKWQSYEEVATFLLNKIALEFGLESVEGRQIVGGQDSGTSWEIDAKGICEDQTAFIIIEMRRHTTRRITQKDLGSIVYQIQDTGAAGGIVVSPLGLQEGARKVAAANRIQSIQLNETSTTTEYLMRFLGRVMLGLKPEALTVSARPLGGTLKRISSSTGKRK